MDTEILQFKTLSKLSQSHLYQLRTSKDFYQIEFKLRKLEIQIMRKRLKTVKANLERDLKHRM